MEAMARSVRKSKPKINRVYYMAGSPHPHAPRSLDPFPSHESQVRYNTTIEKEMGNTEADAPMGIYIRDGLLDSSR